MSISGTTVAPYSAKDWCSVNSAEILLVMECESDRQGTEHHRTHSGCMHCSVLMVLFLTSVVSVVSPHLTWAAVYKCLDAAGKPLLTNRPAALHHCHMLSEATTPHLTSPDVSTPQQVSPPPSPPSYVPNDPPMPWNPPTDGASTGSLPAPYPGAQSSPFPSPPCARGLNPLNPLSTPPCVESDQLGAQPPGAASAPSP